MKPFLLLCFLAFTTLASAQLRVAISTPVFDSDDFFQIEEYRDKWSSQRLIEKGFPLQFEAGFRMWFSATRKVGFDMTGVLTRKTSTIQVSQTTYTDGMLKSSETINEVLEWGGGFSAGPLFRMWQNESHNIYLSTGIWLQDGLGNYLGGHYEWRGKYLSIGGFIKGGLGFTNNRYGFGKSVSWPFIVLCGTELRINILD